MRFRLTTLASLIAGGFIACNTYTPDLVQGGSVLDDSTGAGGTKLDTSTTTRTTNSTATSDTDSTATSTSSNSGSGGSGEGGAGSGGSTAAGSGGSTTDGSNGGNGGNGGTTSTDTTTTATTSANSGGGGNGGNGGSTTGSNTTGPPPDPDMIDDMEDGDNKVDPNFDGYWFTSMNAEGTGTITPAEDEDCDAVDLPMARGMSTRGMHLSGSVVADDWTGLVGFSFYADEKEYDATANAYTGISFFVRSETPGIEVIVQLPLAVTESTGAHHGYELMLPGSWTEVTFTWDDLAQPSWLPVADRIDFDPTALVKVQFQFSDEDFDLWLDDIRFTTE